MMRTNIWLSRAILTGGLWLLIGCSAQTEPAPQAQENVKASAPKAVDSDSGAFQSRMAYFGDLHVHTNISNDSYIFANTNDLDDAYEFAKGAELPIGNREAGITQKLVKPLDFVAITDHSESFGYYARCVEDEYESELCEAIRRLEYEAYDYLYHEAGGGPPPERNQPTCLGSDGEDECYNDGLRIWQDVQRAAEDHNNPGEFVTFVGYEYSPIYEGGMLHRNIIFKNDQVPGRPRDAYNTTTAKDLRNALDADCRNNTDLDCDVVVIPHNSNWTWGAAFATVDRLKKPITREDFEQRLDIEPLIEIVQVKGASECGVGIGNTEDELCDFEKLFDPCEDQGGIGAPQGSRAAAEPEICTRPGSFARSGLKLGIELAQTGAYNGLNPFKFGFIGSTDTHNSTPGATVESDWKGHEGNQEYKAKDRLGKKIGYNPGGLAGVWATEKTRGAIFDALKRREAFGTSGTRIKVRFFGSWTYGPDLLSNPGWEEEAYDHGVPMGRDLLPRENDANPRFLIWAQKEPGGADLQRIQVVKGWTDTSRGKPETREEVIDIDCAATSKPERGQSCEPPQFDPTSCRVSPGSAELRTLWEDEEFDPSQHAFYYVRVLEMPTCRWSSYDKQELGRTPAPEDAVQQRAWSSPIWFTPPAN